MVEFKIIRDEMLETVECLLEYFSGKRAGNAEEYYRCSVCSADSKMLSQLLLESLVWLSVRTARIWFCGSPEEDIVRVEVDIETDGERKQERIDGLERLLRKILIYRIIFLWFRLIGWPDLQYWEDETEKLMESIVRLAGLHGRLKPRRSFPFENF